MSFYASQLVANFDRERNKYAATIARMAGITYDEFIEKFNAWVKPMPKTTTHEMSYYLDYCYQIVNNGNKLPWQHPELLIIVANDHQSARLWRQRNDIPVEYFTERCAVVTPKDHRTLDGIDTRGCKFAICSTNVNIFNLDTSIQDRLIGIEDVSDEYQILL